MIAEVEAEEETTVTEVTEVEVTPEPTIEEQIAEDEAAVAEVCDEPEIHVETDEEYQKRVAEIEGEALPLGSDDMNSCPKHQEDEELKELDELIKGQVIVDKQIAEESVMDITEDADFDLDFSVSNTESSNEDTEVEEGDLPDLF